MAYLISYFLEGLEFRNLETWLILKNWKTNKFGNERLGQKTMREALSLWTYMELLAVAFCCRLPYFCILS